MGASENDANLNSRLINGKISPENLTKVPRLEISDGIVPEVLGSMLLGMQTPGRVQLAKQYAPSSSMDEIPVEYWGEKINTRQKQVQAYPMWEDKKGRLRIAKTGKPNEIQSRGHLKSKDIVAYGFHLYKGRIPDNLVQKFGDDPKFYLAYIMRQREVLEQK